VKVRNAARAAVLAIGAFYAWQARYFVNPDGVAYFDVADTWLQRGWFAAIHTHRSPIFPILLASANRILHLSPYYESTVAHGVAFAMYCVAFLALEFLLTQLGNSILVWLAYVLFLWACNFATETGPAVLTPDLLVAAAVFLAAALLVRIANGTRDWTSYAALGVTLGLGYLSKEAMLPIGAFLLIAAAIAGGRRALPRAAFAAALFAAIACFYVVPLSMKLGRFSAGETSRYNWIIWIGSTGRAVHPKPILFRAPSIEGYQDAASPGSYAVADDWRYWLEGKRPSFDLRAVLLNVRHGIGAYSEIFRSPLQFALLVVFLSLLFLSSNRRGVLRRYWFLTLPSIATLAMFAVVLVLPRYVAPSIVVLWLGLFAGLEGEVRQAATRMIAAAAVAVVLLLATSRETLSELQVLMQRPVHQDWLVAERLRQAGIRPGDHVVVLDDAVNCYWARLADVRVAGHGLVAHEFRAATAARQEAAEEALQRLGIRAIVGRDFSVNNAPRFERVENTPYAICVFRR
jgi:hypothetical protein